MQSYVWIHIHSMFIFCTPFHDFIARSSVHVSLHVSTAHFHRTFPRHVFHATFSTPRFPRHVFHATFSTPRFPRHVFHATFSTPRFPRHVLSNARFPRHVSNARFHLLYTIHPVYLYGRLRHFMYNVHIAVLPLDISSLAAVLQQFCSCLAAVLRQSCGSLAVVSQQTCSLITH